MSFSFCNEVLSTPGVFHAPATNIIGGEGEREKQRQEIGAAFAAQTARTI